MKSKILFIIPSFKSGGIERYLLRFLKEKKSNFHAIVLGRDGTQGELFNAYQGLGVNLILMPLGYLNPFRLIKFYNLLQREKFDIVCDFNANFSGITMFIAWICKVKLKITWYRQASDHFKDNKIKRLYNYIANRLVLCFSDKILFNSYTALNFFFKENEISNKFKVIYNGVNKLDVKPTVTKEKIKMELGIPLQSFIIGHVGRLDEVKNHKAILNLGKELKKENDLFHFVCCGREVPNLQSQIEKENLQECFTLLDYRNDINNILSLFDLFYFPSITEGQPNALIEAMMAGLPFVASNINAIKECIPKKAADQLVPPHDYLGAAKLIKQILIDTDLKKNFIHTSWAEESFDAEKRFNEFLEELGF